MKIELHLNPDTLIACHKILKKVYEVSFSVNKIENVYMSIGFDLADAFDKKVKTKIKKADLFDQKKLSKITLKYHEAWALHHILINLKPFLENKFMHHQIQSVINTLNQKIC